MMELIAELIGEEAAGRLVERFGGIYVVIPDPDDPPASGIAAAVLDCLGAADARRLRAHFGSERIYIPNRMRLALETRNGKIREDRRRGMTVRALALKYCLSERQITKILNR